MECTAGRGVNFQSHKRHQTIQTKVNLLSAFITPPPEKAAFFSQPWPGFGSSRKLLQGFPGGASGKEHFCQSRRLSDEGPSLGSGRSPEGGHGNSLQYSCLDSPMDGEAWKSIGSQSVRHNGSDGSIENFCSN